MVYRITNRRLKSAGWAVRTAAFSVVIIVVAIVLHRLFGLSTPVALNLFMLAFAGAALAVLLSIYSLWRIWRIGYHGTGNSLVAIALVAGIFMWPVSMLPTINSLPNINDVTTDVERPPQFVKIAAQRPVGSNTLVYPGDTFANQQRKAYPDLRTMVVERDAIETTALVASALKRLKMDVVREEAPERSTGYIGHVEAIDRTLVFGFYDDVVVRITSNGPGAFVDIRSVSRYGSHDLGRNAERVRKIMTALVERIQATVPKKGSKRRRGRRPVSRRSRQNRNRGG